MYSSPVNHQLFAYERKIEVRKRESTLYVAIAQFFFYWR